MQSFFYEKFGIDEKKDVRARTHTHTHHAYSHTRAHQLMSAIYRAPVLTLTRASEFRVFVCVTRVTAAINCTLQTTIKYVSTSHYYTIMTIDYNAVSPCSAIHNQTCPCKINCYGNKWPGMGGGYMGHTSTCILPHNLTWGYGNVWTCLFITFKL